MPLSLFVCLSQFIYLCLCVRVCVCVCVYVFEKLFSWSSVFSVAVLFCCVLYECVCFCLFVYYLFIYLCMCVWKSVYACVRASKVAFFIALALAFRFRHTQFQASWSVVCAIQNASLFDSFALLNVLRLLELQAAYILELKWSRFAGSSLGESSNYAILQKVYHVSSIPTHPLLLGCIIFCVRLSGKELIRRGREGAGMGGSVNWSCIKF